MYQKQLFSSVISNLTRFSLLMEKYFLKADKRGFLARFILRWEWKRDLDCCFGLA